MSTTTQAIINGYEESSNQIIEAYQSISTEQLLQPVIQHIPNPEKNALRALDIGAGTGRDALWLAKRGYQVTAVEPTLPLRRFGIQQSTQLPITWLNDTLPLLKTIQGPQFDLIFVFAVWHHLTTDAQRQSLQTIYRLLAPGGRIVLSCRHGPSLRPAFLIDVETLIADAEAAELRLIHRAHTNSIQSNNQEAEVTWTWMVLAK